MTASLLACVVKDCMKSFVLEQRVVCVAKDRQQKYVFKPVFFIGVATLAKDRTKKDDIKGLAVVAKDREKKKDFGISVVANDHNKNQFSKDMCSQFYFILPRIKWDEVTAASVCCQRM